MAKKYYHVITITEAAAEAAEAAAPTITIATIGYHQEWLKWQIATMPYISAFNFARGWNTRNYAGQRMKCNTTQSQGRMNTWMYLCMSEMNIKQLKQTKK